MIPASFDYRRVETFEEAVAALALEARPPDRRGGAEAKAAA